MRKTLALCAIFAIFTAQALCAAPGATEQKSSDKIKERQRLIWVLGEDFRFVWDPEVTAFVNRIGKDLALAIGTRENSFHLYVIDHPSMNAFATPLGDIFFFSGLLGQMHNSSELAGVLAHEMAHVRADHFGRMQKKAAISSIPGFMAAILSKGDVRVIASAIAAAQSFQLHWSREMELESDRLALQYLSRTKYDKSGLLGALEILQQGQALMPFDAPEGLMSHPIISSRIAVMEGGLGGVPGKHYEPAHDGDWERMKAVLLAVTERSDVAKGIYRRKLSSGDPEASALMGLVLLRQGNNEEAEKHLRAALELDGSNRRYMADLGAALFHQGRFAEARDLFQKSLSGPGPDYSYPHYYLSEIFRQNGNDEEGFRSLQRAVELWPPVSEAHYQLALMLVEREKLGQADYHFGKASSLRGDFAGAYRSFSRAEDRLGTDPLWSTRIAEEMWRMQ
jgi:predicted Zn-dependent protease